MSYTEVALTGGLLDQRNRPVVTFINKIVHSCSSGSNRLKLIVFFLHGKSNIESLLHLYTINNNLNEIKKLIEDEFIDIDLQKSDGYSALMLASKIFKNFIIFLYKIKIKLIFFFV